MEATHSALIECERLQTDNTKKQLWGGKKTFHICFLIMIHRPTQVCTELFSLTSLNVTTSVKIFSHVCYLSLTSSETGEECVSSAERRPKNVKEPVWPAGQTHPFVPFSCCPIRFLHLHTQEQNVMGSTPPAATNTKFQSYDLEED